MLSTRKSENLVYLLLWILVFGIVALTIRQQEESFPIGRLIMERIRLTPFILIFLLNRIVLYPKFLLQKKYVTYFIVLAISIFLIAYFFDFSRYLSTLFPPDNRLPEFEPKDLGPHPPAIHLKLGPPSKWARILDCAMFSFLVIGVNNAIALVFKRQEEEQRNEEQQNMYLQTELSLLRQQMSPHFFMNTLNNIHALIDVDKEMAQESVIKLSKMMRYLLEESNTGKSTIKKELDFLYSYVDLMRLRFSEKVKIEVKVNVINQEKEIPSLLFISIIENAFKYGVSYQHPSFISIEAKEDGDFFYFLSENSYFSNNKSESTGIGLDNLRKQLQLLYGEDYQLAISDSGDVFRVTLRIPLDDRLYSH